MNAGDKLIDKESRTEIEIQGNIGKAWIYTIGGTAVYFGTEEIILEKYTPAEPVNEEDEKDQEAIKWLESRGYRVFDDKNSCGCQLNFRTVNFTHREHCPYAKH